MNLAQNSPNGSRGIAIDAGAGAGVVEHNAVAVLRTLLPLSGVRDLEPPGRIFVGASAAAAALGPRGAERELAGLGADGIRILTIDAGRGLTLSGGHIGARGTLQAVYRFARLLGFRWWTPEAVATPNEQMRDANALRGLGGFNVRHVPSFRGRLLYTHAALDRQWAAAHGINASFRAEEGGPVSYALFVHTFHDLVPPDRFADEHPDWFAEVEGRRVGRFGQLCLSNDEIVPVIVDGVRTALDAHPEASIVSVSQMDPVGDFQWGLLNALGRPPTPQPPKNNYAIADPMEVNGRCTCARCRELEDRHGGPAGPLLHMLNAVAAPLAESHPYATLSTLAYQYTRHAPVGIRPARNVAIHLASIECNTGHPFDHPTNEPFKRDLDAWSRVAHDLHAWDYMVDYENHFQPHANLRSLPQNLRFWRDAGVSVLFLQGHLSPGGGFCELREYLAARLMWDVDEDPKAICDEFLTGYYGMSAASIAAWTDEAHDQIEAGGVFVDCHAGHRSAHITARLLTAGELMCARALRDADDETIALRVRRVRLSVRIAALLRWHDFSTWSDWPYRDGRAALFADVRADAAALGVSALDSFGRITLDSLESPGTAR